MKLVEKDVNAFERLAEHKDGAVIAKKAREASVWLEKHYGKALHAFGLHGQSVFPMMLGFGCSIPAIMAARTLKSRRDRIVTILVIPFMSCGAKLPVYVLLVALVFKQTILKGDPTPFVMELPPYRAPTLRGVLWHVWEKTASYLKKMGTVIMAASIVIRAITNFPVYKLSPSETVAVKTAYATQHPDASSDAVQASADIAASEAAIEHSAAGAIGKFVQPVFAPIGFDWKLSVATITGFAAKKVIVSTLGILYRAPESEADGNGTLSDALRADPHWNPLLAFVLMIFTLAIPPA